jgi:hypothetical protein
MYTKLFWKDTFERVLSSMASSVLAMLTVVQAGTPIDWRVYGAAVFVAGLTSLLKCITAVSTTPGNSASFTVDNVKQKQPF